MWVRNTLIDADHLLTSRLEKELWTLCPSRLEVDNSADGLSPWVLSGEEVRRILKRFLRIVEHCIMGKNAKEEGAEEAGLYSQITMLQPTSHSPFPAASMSTRATSKLMETANASSAAPGDGRVESKCELRSIASDWDPSCDEEMRKRMFVRFWYDL